MRAVGWARRAHLAVCDWCATAALHWATSNAKQHVIYTYTLPLGLMETCFPFVCFYVCVCDCDAFLILSWWRVGKCQRALTYPEAVLFRASGTSCHVR